MFVAVSEFNKSLGFILEDKESINDEVKLKYLNILKMLIYVYTQTVLMLEHRNVASNDQILKSRKKSVKDKDEFILDRKNVLLLLNNIIQREISLFFDPPVVEENFVSLISGMCYEFLQNPAIKNEKEVLPELFNILGYLVKAYNHGTTFVVRITQLIKLQEHLLHCIPKGVQQIVQNFNCKGLLHDMIEELTEWQLDDKNSDGQVNMFYVKLYFVSNVILKKNVFLFSNNFNLKFEIENVNDNMFNCKQLISL